MSHNNTNVFVSRDEAGEKSGVSMMRLDKLTERGLVRKKGAKVHLQDIINHMTLEDSDDENPTVAQVKLRKLTADAQLAELKLAEQKKSLLPVEEVVQQGQKFTSLMVSRLMSMPSKLAPLLASCDSVSLCREMIEDGVRESIEELLRHEYFIDEEMGRSNKATTKANRKSVGRRR